MIRQLAAGFVILLILTVQIASAAEVAAEKAAVSAAERWLKLVDEGRYAESWKQTARFFKTGVKPESWEDAMRSVRQPLGNTVSRKIKSKQFTTMLPGAPDGEYVVIQFETAFVNKKSAVETVSPMRDKDGIWRVSGYYIK